ncbi:hypothetical protein [Microbispora catharanthi]|uniref:Uncharacterized protein n=1 Tax=Microbispora catharanthi TaxID=1712871 RepID=A0A5N6BIT4_9ACTN|nr:hypothetical protein [Microbispora catharanthi]KAB8180362.1 hypothetical protein FH610_032730 [Microbispora catharanthi]
MKVLLEILRVIDDALPGGSDIRAGLRRFLHATLAELDSAVGAFACSHPGPWPAHALHVGSV